MEEVSFTVTKMKSLQENFPSFRGTLRKLLSCEKIQKSCFTGNIKATQYRVDISIQD